LRVSNLAWGTTTEALSQHFADLKVSCLRGGTRPNLQPKSHEHISGRRMASRGQGSQDLQQTLTKVDMCLTACIMELVRSVWLAKLGLPVFMSLAVSWLQCMATKVL
jgi:hypothetical protein